LGGMAVVICRAIHPYGPSRPRAYFWPVLDQDLGLRPQYCIMMSKSGGPNDGQIHLVAPHAN
jgi:hypothetical protein